MIKRIRAWWWHRKFAHKHCLLCDLPLGDGPSVYMDQTANGKLTMAGYAHWPCAHQYLYGYAIGSEEQDATLPAGE